MWYYPFNLGDYLRDTAHLSEREDLAYRRMLDEYYREEGPLRGDAAAIARRLRMRDAIAEVQAVLEEFFEQTPEGWKQDRCEQELVDYRRAQEQKSSAGRASAEKRKKQKEARAQRAKERALNGRATGDGEPSNERGTKQETGTMNQPQPGDTERATGLSGSVPEGRTYDSNRSEGAAQLVADVTGARAVRA